MVKDRALTRRMLILNPGAGSVTDEVRKRLAEEFSDFQLVEFPPSDGWVGELDPEDALVVACGGDGTIAAVARALAGTRHSFGILAMGTFNNFARALGLPTDFEDAVRVIKEGRPRDCTLGSVNGEEFLEAAAIGLFGQSIALGETAKDWHFGELGGHLREMAATRGFHFRVEGDVALAGTAVSLIIANTPSTGARVPVSDTSPEEPALELSIHRGASRLAFVWRILGAVLRRQPPAEFETHKVRSVRIVTSPPMKVYADASEVGETPAEVKALRGGLRVILPA